MTTLSDETGALLLEFVTAARMLRSDRTKRNRFGKLLVNASFADTVRWLLLRISPHRQAAVDTQDQLGMIAEVLSARMLRELGGGDDAAGS